MSRFMTPDPPPCPRQGTHSDPDFRPSCGIAVPAADGGYPADSDLHQMSDDGCPNGPNPARWADPDWRDNLGEWDPVDDVGSPAGRSLTA